MYTVGEISKMFDLPISTLRYYDKEGLLLKLQRDKSGIRKFNDKTIEALRVIECLKKTGMSIKEIKEFMKWCSLGDNTLLKRRQMFVKQKKSIESQIKELEKVLDMIKYKCWYYDEAIKDGNEKRVRTITLDKMPSDIKEAFKRAHDIN